MNWWTLVALIVFVYILSVLRRAKLEFWYFLIGSAGVFMISMLFIRPILINPLIQAVTMITGNIGEMLNLFEGYPEYALLFVENKSGAISLIVDYECAGIIEMAAFFSLLMFFPAYLRMEKILVGICGGLYLFFANVLRLVVICVTISIFGNDAYFLVHSVIGRIIFYGLSMVLYYVVFTKTQIIRQKVGNFSYEDK